MPRILSITCFLSKLKFIFYVTKSFTRKNKSCFQQIRVTTFFLQNVYITYYNSYFFTRIFTILFKLIFPFFNLLFYFGNCKQKPCSIHFIFNLFVYIDFGVSYESWYEFYRIILFTCLHRGCFYFIFVYLNVN